MPTYLYKHPDTGEVKEVIHKMSDIDTPSEETLKEISTEDGRIMERVPAAPALMEFSMSSKEGKKKILKKRSSDHFKKEVREVQANLNGETGAQF